MKAAIKYRFGDKLRDVRDKKGLTLKTIASRAHVSESLISQIERNKVSPSIDTLLAIADALEIDIDYLFQDYKLNKKVDYVTDEDRAMIRVNTVVYKKLSIINNFNTNNDMEVFLVDVDVNGEQGDNGYGHPGKELGYVLSGQGELIYGTECYQIKTGDSISFASDIPHTLRNTGDTVLKTVWVTTPPRRMFFRD